MCCVSALQEQEELTQDGIKPIEVQMHFLLTRPGDEGGVREGHTHHRPCFARLPRSPGPQQPCMGCQALAVNRAA